MAAADEFGIEKNIHHARRALGQQTTLEGKPALTVPLRFEDGAILLGPVMIGRMAALF